MRRLLLILLILFVAADALHAQIQVALQIKRRLFVAYEPIVATVSIRNLSGRDLPLADKDGQPWFSFEVLRANGQPVPPIDIEYKLTPLIIPPGATVERKVVLNTLYPVQDFGLYRVRASIYFSPYEQFFQSPPANIEVSEGRTLWQQVVGVPDGKEGAGGNRRYTVLTFRRPSSNYVYVRVEDVETGSVFCTHSIGRLITGVDPEIKLDAQNNLHVLHLTGAKLYQHTEVGLNGELVNQASYLAVKYRPGLRLSQAGDVAVRGGQLQTNDPTPSGPSSMPDVPKLSDRPVNMPKG
jgi:hypothetical protein